MDLSQPAGAVEVGRAARDRITQRAGVVIAIEGPTVRLRELHTGHLWTAHVDTTEALSARTELSLRARVAYRQTHPH